MAVIKQTTRGAAVNFTQRPQSGISFLDAAVVCLLPIILNLPQVTSEALGRSALSGIFILMIWKLAILQPAINFRQQEALSAGIRSHLNGSNRLLFWTLAFLAVLTVAEIRGAYTGTTSAISFIGFTAWTLGIFLYATLLTATCQNEEAKNQLVKCLGASLGLFICVNIAGHFAGLHGPRDLENSGPNKILSLVGINYLRIAFPFSSGLNSFGIIAGLAVVLGITLRSTNGKGSFVGPLLLILLGFLGIVLADTRGALVSIALFMLLTRILASSHGSAIKKIIPVLLPLLPAAIMGIIGITQFIGISDLMTREGDFAARLGAASGRDVIWRAAYQRFLSGDPMSIIGWGSFGHIASKLTSEYAWVFSQIAGQTNATAHNATIQMILDTGLLGLALWMRLWYVILNSTESSNSKSSNPIAAKAMYGVALYIMLAGLTEVGGTPYQSDSFGVFIFSLGILSVITNSSTTPGASKSIRQS